MRFTARIDKQSNRRRAQATSAAAATTITCR